MERIRGYAKRNIERRGYMEITKSMAVMVEALQTLQEGIELFHEYEGIVHKQPSEKNEKFFKATRDSLIQRFEYCTDLFWKFTKVYLIEIEKMDVSIQSPRGIIREAAKAGVFSEGEGDECMDMVEGRNRTSHTYHEQTADEIAHQIPTYYELMHTMIDRMKNIVENR